MDGRFDVTDESKIERSSTAYVFRIRIDLHLPDFRSWQEFRKRKISPKHQKEVGMVDRSISAAISEQARQSYGEGIVVLQPLLTSQRVADGRLQSCRQLDYLFARVPAPIATKNSNGASLVNHVGEAAQVRI